MLELLENNVHSKIEDYKTNKIPVFLDTCFLIYLAENNLFEKLLNYKDKYDFLILSFNLLELDFHFNHMKNIVKRSLRKILKKSDNVKIIEIEVKPGNSQDERNFVNKIDLELLNLIKDPSDAVLFASLLLIKKGIILTRDKHHLFTEKLENYITTNYCKINVYKEINNLNSIS